MGGNPRMTQTHCHPTRLKTVMSSNMVNLICHMNFDNLVNLTGGFLSGFIM